MTCRRAVRRSSGFTLVELLAVVAIIAVLAAILFPVLYRAREKGRQTSCLNNLCQLGKAFRMYADDNNGYAPRLFFGVRWSGYRSTDPQSPLYRYVGKSPRVFYCPSEVFYFEGQWDAARNPAILQVNKPSCTSYGYNYWGPGNWPPGSGMKTIKVRLEDIPIRPTGRRVPSRLKNTVRDWSTISRIYILDEYTWSVFDGESRPEYVDRNNDGIRDCYQRHGDTGSNILFSDGHAYFVRGYDNSEGGF